MLPTTQILAGSIAAGCLAIQLACPPTVHAPAGPRAGAVEREAAGPQRRRKKTAKSKARLTPFLGTLSEAKKAAREQNVPLLIHIILEGEPQNDEYRDEILPDQDLIDRSVKAVVVIANNGDHDLRKIEEEVEGEKVTREACSAYPWFESCADHRRAWDEVYAAFREESGEMRCPQTVILLPDGSQAWRFNTANPPEVGQVTSELGRAQKRAGPGLSRDELVKVKRLAADARRSTDGELWSDAWKAWSEILEILPAGHYADEARAALPGIEAGMKKELEAARALLVPGKAAEGYAILARMAEEWAGTSKEGELRREMIQAEKRKEIKEEIRLFKLEREGEALWNEAMELLKKGERRSAEKLIRKLKRKKYEGTKIGDRAREEYPDLE